MGTVMRGFAVLVLAVMLRPADGHGWPSAAMSTDGQVPRESTDGRASREPGWRERRAQDAQERPGAGRAGAAAAAETRYTVPAGDSPSIGAPGAPVVIVEFLDYQ